MIVFLVPLFIPSPHSSIQIQAHLMQANYFRAPTNLDGFRGGDQGIAQLNNEQAAANGDQTGAGGCGSTRGSAGT